MKQFSIQCKGKKIQKISLFNFDVSSHHCLHRIAYCSVPTTFNKYFYSILLHLWHLRFHCVDDARIPSRTVVTLALAVRCSNRPRLYTIHSSSCVWACGLFLLRLKWPKLHLRYVHFIAESAQYIFNNIPRMGGFFNWSMCNKKDADFWRPDGMIVQVKRLRYISNATIQVIINCCLKETCLKSM